MPQVVGERVGIGQVIEHGDALAGLASPAGGTHTADPQLRHPILASGDSSPVVSATLAGSMYPVHL